MKSTKRASHAKFNGLSNPSSSSCETSSDVSTPNSISKRIVALQFSTIIRLVFAFFLFLFWRVRYGDFLYMSQEYDLFLWNYAYLVDASVRIAGLSRYLSSFFIQFFYCPTLGALILVGFSLFIQYATEKLFRLRGWISVLSYLPVCLLTLQITNARYLFFENRDVAYLFSFVFNLAFALAFALLFNSIRSIKLRVTFFLVATLLTYPVFGFFTLFGAVVCLALESTLPVDNSTSASSYNSKKTPVEKKRELCELLLLFILAVPALFYLLIYADTTPSLQYAYVSGVLEESIVSAEAEPYMNFVYRFYIRDFYLVLCAVFYVGVSLFAFVFCKQGANSDAAVSRSSYYQAISRVVVVGVLTIFCVGTILCSYATVEYRSLLTIGRALDRQDWNKVIKTEAKIPAPNEASISARYLALTRSGRMPDELFERPVMPAMTPELNSVPAFVIFGDRVLYEYGLTNLAERTASNNLVPKRDHSFWSNKTSALCAIANEQYALALRILWNLKGACFHRRWAQELIDYVFWKDSSTRTYDRFVTTNGTSEERLREIDEQFKKVKRQSPFDDDYSPKYSVENMRFSLISWEDITRREIDDFEARLVAILAMREYDRFAPLFDQYLAIKGKEPLPRHFQEAALLREKYPALFMEQSWTIPEDVSIDPKIRTRFKEFVRLFISTKTDKSAKEKIKQYFSDTIWYATMR